MEWSSCQSECPHVRIGVGHLTECGGHVPDALRGLESLIQIPVWSLPHQVRSLIFWTWVVHACIFGLLDAADAVHTIADAVSPIGILAVHCVGIFSGSPYCRTLWVKMMRCPRFKANPVVSTNFPQLHDLHNMKTTKSERELVKFCSSQDWLEDTFSFIRCPSTADKWYFIELRSRVRSIFCINFDVLLPRLSPSSSSGLRSTDLRRRSSVACSQSIDLGR